MEFLLFLVRRHGYSPRAFPAVLGFAFLLFPFSAWLAASRPFSHDANFNWVRGLFDVQSNQAPWLGLVFAGIGYLVVLVLPAHFVLQAVASRSEERRIHGL